MAVWARPSDDLVDNSYRADGLRPGLHRAGLGPKRHHLPDLPRPLPQRAQDNDPKTGEVRYDDPVISLPWGTLPEGYCRNYADGSDQLSVAL